MGLFDGGAQDAANSQIQALQQGLAAAQQQITGAGNDALTANYTAALQPYLQNNATAQQGVTQLGNLLGLNGTTGTQNANTTLQSTPGYQFQKQAGNNAINAQAAATGQLGSGNQATALANYNQGLAGTTYQNAVSNLSPYLSLANSSASGIGNTYSNLGSQLNSNFNTLGQDYLQGISGMGAAQANADLASGSGLTSLLKGVAGLGTNTLGGSAISSLGSGLMSLFSDENLKEDIKPVGELYDGTNIYSYKYKGDETPRIGVMAQEVQKKNPDAVTEIGGFLAVDYGKATQYAAELAPFFKDAA